MRIVIVSNNDWDGLWYQRQQLASMYAEKGHEVLFINKTLQRMPKIKDFLDRFGFKGSVTAIKQNEVPSGVTIKSIYTLPPFKFLNRINKYIINRSCNAIAKWQKCDLLITYVPTYVALDIMEYFSPQKKAYINVHNYDADHVISDLLKSEHKVCSMVDYLFADSVFNNARLHRISSGREVGYSEPGVNTTRFFAAHRGDESKQRKKICYFGGIGNHLNFDVYNSLAEKYEVYFVGSINSKDVKTKLSDKIHIIPPVGNHELPQILRNMDIMGIFYNPTDYVNGVIPAKIYECLATLKPTITSGLGNLERLQGSLYCVPENEIIYTIENLEYTETSDVFNLRRYMAECADWKQRFIHLNKYMNIDA